MNEFSYILNHVYTKIKPSKLQGVGLFALRDIPEGVEVFKSWDGKTGRYKITEGQLDTLPKALYSHIKDIFLYAPDFPNDTATYITLTNGCHWIYTTPYYFVNSDINKFNIDKDTLRSVREIKAGEEILSNYGRYERLSKLELI